MADPTTPVADPTTPAPAPAPAAKPSPAADMVPRSRLNDVIRQRDEAIASLEAQARETDTWRAKASTVDSLTQKFDADRESWGKEREQWQTKSAAYQHGVTDNDLVDLALWQYDRITPAEGETKPAFGDWLGGLKANPDALPAPLAGLRTAWAPAAAPAAAPAGAPAGAPAPAPAGTPAPVAVNPKTGAPVARAQPAPNAGAVGTATVPQTHTPGSVSKMTLAEYREHRKTIGLS